MKMERITVGGKSNRGFSSMKKYPDPYECDDVCDEDEETLLKQDSVVWCPADDRYYANPPVTEKVDAGCYTVDVDNKGIYLQRMHIALDNLIELPDSESEQILSSIETFWQNEDKFREYGFLWKRGILLYGPPGGGKTSTVQTVISRIVAQGDVAVYCDNPLLAKKILKSFRTIEPNRKMVVIFEDLDSIIDEHHEHDILAILDGEVQIDNVVFLATTNYPEKLNKRIINRPSRFDIVQRIDMPTDEAKKIYLEHKGVDEEIIERWIPRTKEYSIAHLKELIVSILVMGVDEDDTFKRIDNMISDRPTSDHDGGKHSRFGFSG